MFTKIILFCLPCQIEEEIVANEKNSYFLCGKCGRKSEVQEKEYENGRD
jgi:predicted RNA-binding Zn-ribbon protein involved in translation (DUF1610 family)